MSEYTWSSPTPPGVHDEYVLCLEYGNMKDPDDGSEFQGLQRKLKAPVAANREKEPVSV